MHAFGAINRVSNRVSFIHVSRLLKALGICLVALCGLVGQAIAACGYVDLTAFPSSADTYKFVDGGYQGFASLGKTTADCYAALLTKNGEMGKELLATLYAGKTTTAIDQLRGRSPAYKLLVAHRGGPDWAHGIPDNSVEAFKQSIGNGISSVEVDLQMDSKRNLLAFHDTSFADMVRSDDATLKSAIPKAIQDYEWITMASDTRKLDESKLYKLRRVIPNAFSLYSSNPDLTTTLRLSNNATQSPLGASVASFPRILSEIQTASKTKFNSATAVNIFVDAAKSRDITIATINSIRRMNLIAQGSLFNQTNYAVPATQSIAVQFRIKDFPNGASDLIQALCDSPENKVTYKFDKKISRVYGRPFMGGSTFWYDETSVFYSDSADNFTTKYGLSVTKGAEYLMDFVQPGLIYWNGNPLLKLWGDAASGTCSNSHFMNSGIALVPVVEQDLPYKVSRDSTGNARNMTDIVEAGKGILDFLEPFRDYFKLNIIEFSFTTSDELRYYSADSTSTINTGLPSASVFAKMAGSARDKTFSQPFIYQTFNRFFDLALVTPGYDGPYLCASRPIGNSSDYGYFCSTQTPGSLDDQKFEFRSKPGVYTGACNGYPNSPFQTFTIGLTTTDNPLLEVYMSFNGLIPDPAQFTDLCSLTNSNQTMSKYTKRYRSFVGNPSFRLSGGI